MHQEIQYSLLCIFLIYEKEMRRKIAQQILGFIGMLFSRFEKGMSKETAPESLTLVSMLFLIFEKGMNKKKLLQEF